MITSYGQFGERLEWGPGATLFLLGAYANVLDAAVLYVGKRRSASRAA